MEVAGMITNEYRIIQGQCMKNIRELIIILHHMEFIGKRRKSIKFQKNTYEEARYQFHWQGTPRNLIFSFTKTCF